jgi:hypothetical protein
MTIVTLRHYGTAAGIRIGLLHTNLYIPALDTGRSLTVLQSAAVVITAFDQRLGTKKVASCRLHH